MNKKIIIRLLFFLVLILIIIWLRLNNVHSYVTLNRIQTHALQLKQYVEHNYRYSVFLFITLIMFASASLIPITILLTICSGFLFGPILGAIYSIIGVTIGSSLTFFAVRYLLGQFVQRYFKQRLFHLNKEITIYGAQYLLILQIIPFTPTIAINLLAGLTKLSWWTFAWTTALGILPGTLLYTWAGFELIHIKKISDILTVPWLIAFFAIAVILLASIFYKKKVKPKKM